MNKKNILIIDPGGYKYSLTTELLYNEFKKRGALCKKNTKITKDTKIILFTFRSPWPNFLWALQILKDVNIPILRKNRKDNHPLIICGGIAMNCPFPFYDFFDAAWIGDATKEAFDLIAEINEKNDVSRNKALVRLYQCGFLAPEYQKGKVPIHIVRPYSMFAHVVSNQELLLNRWWAKNKNCNTIMQIEVKRGCRRGCSFCVDFNNPPASINSSELYQILKNTIIKYPNLSTVRLSFSTLLEEEFEDYIDITQKVKNECEANFTIDIGSTVPDQFSFNVAKRLKKLGQNSMIFAPEVCDKIINGINLRKENKKWLTDKILFNAIENGYKAGLKYLTLYNLTGFPKEKYSHVKAYAALVKRIVITFPQLKKITISSGPVFPTISTPLENAAQISFHESKKRWLYLSDLLKDESKIKTLWWLDIQENKLVPYKSNPEISYSRAYFYRAPKSMSKVLMHLVNKYPNHNDYLSISIKQLKKYIKAQGIDITKMLKGDMNIDSKLFKTYYH